MLLTRRMWLALPLASAACSDDDGPIRLEPLRYDYLTPLRINVASIDYGPLPPPSPLDGSLQSSAAVALQQLAQDRLSAAGSSGRGLITVEEARVVPGGGGLQGTMAMRLDVLAASGSPAGYAEARVARSRSGGTGRAAIQTITKQMLDDMNIELEFQIRRSLRDYLQTTSAAPAPAPVTQQDLRPPAR